MILIGLGANLPSPDFGPPAATLEAALEELVRRGVAPCARSRFYDSAPVPMSDLPWFVNAVIAVETALGPRDLLALLLDVEARFGRDRRAGGGDRVLDLDLLAYDNIRTNAHAHPALPHPRMHERAFVLLPLAEIAPHWHHPDRDMPLDALIAALPPGQTARPRPDAGQDR